MTNFVKLVTIKPANLDKPQNGKNYVWNILKTLSHEDRKKIIQRLKTSSYEDQMKIIQKLLFSSLYPYKDNLNEINIDWIKEGF